MSSTAACAPLVEGRRLLIGQSREGLWIVRDAEGICGAVFVNRDAALHFAKSECAAGETPGEWRFVAQLDLTSMFARTR